MQFSFLVLVIFATYSEAYHSGSYPTYDYGLYRMDTAPVQTYAAATPSQPAADAQDSRQNIVSVGDKPIGENVTTTEPVGNSTDTSKNESITESPVVTNSTNVNQTESTTNSDGTGTTEVIIQKTVKVENETSNRTETVFGNYSSSTDGPKKPETDLNRESRKYEPTIKTETSTHQIDLDKIESKLSNSTMDYNVIREMLGTLVGKSKAEEILPKTDDDKTVLTKTKRSVDPEKLVKRKLDNYELKLLFKSLKQQGSKDLKKWKNRSRRSASNYLTQNTFPSGQLPELFVPPGSSLTQGSAPYGSTRTLQDIPVRSGEGFRYAVKTAPRDINRFRSGSDNYARSAQPFRSSSNYLTDLSDLPVSREHFRGIVAPEDIRLRSAVPAFRKVTIVEAYSVPAQMAAQAEIRDSFRTSTDSFRTGTDYNSPSDEAVSDFGKSLANSYSSEQSTAGNNVPLLMPGDTPIRISFADGSRSRRYKRSPVTFEKDISKRRVPMVLSTVSRITRSGPNGPL